MKILSRYILRGYLVVFCMSLLVLSFIMSLGVMVRAMEYLARGVAAAPLARLFFAAMPASLLFTIPVSALVASLLVFGRLSADGEITAMRVAGIGLRQVARPPLALAAVMMCVCVYLGAEVVPRMQGVRRQAMAELRTRSPVELIEAGRFIHDFPGVSLYVGARRATELQRIRLFDFNADGSRREILAQEGSLCMDTNRSELVMELRHVRVDPMENNQPGYIQAWTHRIPVKTGKPKAREDESELSLSELLARVWETAAYHPALNATQVAIKRMTYLVEANLRMVLATACVAFVILGIPLGIKAHRKESSIGIAICLAVVMNFYLFVIFSGSMVHRPHLRPYLIIWVPVAVSLVAGAALLRRAE